jgi:twitching motility two-component system response regulator PilH
LARKILLADDSVTAQNMGRKILADAGYEVITVNNGSAALKKIGEAKPDLIVLDVYMPGYSGLEVCQRLKEVADTSRIPILLTVGKLEPFKPEEAKRVRADAFIVKPFEASELLSALSKLEDKVVPRADSSKPGRFARATAAIEESRYDKTMAVEDDDSGWKSRISFPKKKKEKPPEQEVETGEIYNAVNKDLRTTVANKPGQKVDEPAPVASPASHAPEAHTPEVQTEDPHVNLAALAPEGLPKDVTAEEIAALAAAAAQIKGKVVDEKSAPSAAETPATVESAKSETVAIAKTEPVASAEVHETGKEETHLAEPVPVRETAASAPPATLAAQDTQEKTEEKKPEHKSGPAEVMAAIAGLETEWISLPAAGLGNPIADRSQESAEPVTMAVAANAGASAPAPAQWSAVAVAVAPEEASISLEQEMQKAYAAFAAAESGHAVAQVSAPTPAVPEATTAVAEPPAAQPAATEAAAAIPATSAPEAVQSLSAVSEAATDAVSAAVKELEAVAAKYEAEQKAASSEPRDEKSAKAEALESPAVASAPEPKIEESVETKTEEKPEFAVIEPPVETRTEEAKPEEIKLEDTKTQETKPPETDAPQGIEAAPAAGALAPQIASEEIPPEVPAESEKPSPVIEVPEAVAKQELSDETSSSENVSGEPAPVSKASPAGGIDDMAKRESETAAAWATWRKIRETGGPKSAQSSETSEKESEESLPRDRAAMAVAAGAEGKPEEATNFDADPEIASIVDSVLADMRPKIVEEIARKLGKKK